MKGRPTPVENKSNSSEPFYTEVLRRRLHVISFSYVAALWCFIEISSFLVERYNFPPQLVDIIFIGGLILTPSVLVIGWTHGAPGKDSWGALEKILVPANLAVVLGFTLIFTSLTNNTISREVESNPHVLSEDSQTWKHDADRITKAASKQTYISGYIYPFETLGSSDEIPNSNLVPALVSIYSKRYQNFLIGSPFLSVGDKRSSKLSLQTVNNIHQVPTAKLQEASAEDFEHFFITGTLKRIDIGYQIDYQLTDIINPTNSLTATITGKNEDELSLKLIHEIEKVYQPHNALTIEHPISDVISKNQEVENQYVEALAIANIENKEKNALYLLQELATIDSNCLPCQEAIYQIQSKLKYPIKDIKRTLNNIIATNYQLPNFRKPYYQLQLHVTEANKKHALLLAKKWSQDFEKNHFVFVKNIEVLLLYGQFSTAADLCSNYIAFDNRNPLALRLSLTVFIINQDYTQAKATIDHFRNLYPMSNELNSDFVSILVSENKYDEAIDILETSIANNPKESLFYIHLANLHFSIGQISEAYGTLSLALDSIENDQQHNIHRKRFRMLLSQRRFDEAFVELRILKQFFEKRGEIDNFASQILGPNLKNFLYSYKTDDLSQLVEEVNSNLPEAKYYLSHVLRAEIAALQKDVRALDDNIRLLNSYFKTHFPKIKVNKFTSNLKRAVINEDADSIVELYDKYQSEAKINKALKIFSGPNKYYIYSSLLKQLDFQTLIEKINLNLKHNQYAPIDNFFLAQVLNMQGDKERASEHLKRVLRVWSQAPQNDYLLQQASELSKQLGLPSPRFQ
ncbi:tetratricopeptide repeat protein [Pleionea sediminis]|uniref:tetratricopeptide repeat protein n=1 Tax=Pleionea sediminis TaxID=2569479 RepID=UPI001186999E|nr:tetratricopeptide repeat protein [Pleionea sediminis]